MISAVRIVNLLPLNFLSAHAIDAGGEGQPLMEKSLWRGRLKRTPVLVCFRIKAAIIPS
jgi:hypothetical protein